MNSRTMAEIFAAQRTDFTAELPVSLAIRKDRLKRLGLMIQENAERFVAALSQDYGHRSREQSHMTDIASGLSQVKYNAAHVAGWMRREKRPLQFPMGLLGARAWIEYQPKGVVGVIAPWNFPIQLTVGPISGAFAAGNRVMAKTSEATPGVTALFEKVVGSYFDPTELAFISGGPDVGERFASLPFDHIIFTGATGIARHILRAAAENLVPVTLELGGKSPTIIGRTADMKIATERVALGKMLNAGQICVAPDYVMVPEGQEAVFVDGMRAAITSMYPTLLANDDYTSIINERHHLRLTGYLDDARAKGAQIITINPGNEDFSTTNGNKMPLHLVLNATGDMAVMQEELFGPILPIRGYRTVNEVIDYINGHERPLALYYFGKDEAERRQILDRTIAGGVTLDDIMFHVGMDSLPFGGIGASGMGSYHGIEGFRTFSHAKSIYQQGWVDFTRMGGMRPPYRKKAMAKA